MTLTRAQTLERNWGEEVIFARTETHCGKILRRTAGTKGGFQCHVKEENHYLLDGCLKLRTKEGGTTVERIVPAGTAWTVPPFTVHQEEAITDCVILEVGDPTVEDRYAIEPDPGQLPSMTDTEAIHKLKELASALRRRAVDCDHLVTQLRLDGLARIVTR